MKSYKAKLLLSALALMILTGAQAQEITADKNKVKKLPPIKVGLGARVGVNFTNLIGSFYQSMWLFGFSGVAQRGKSGIEADLLCTIETSKPLYGDNRMTLIGMPVLFNYSLFDKVLIQAGEKITVPVISPRIDRFGGYKPLTCISAVLGLGTNPTNTATFGVRYMIGLTPSFRQTSEHYQLIDHGDPKPKTNAFECYMNIRFVNL